MNKKTFDFVAGGAFSLFGILWMAWFAVVIGLMIGWVMNLFDAFRIISNEIGTEMNLTEVLHLVGVVLLPIGGIMGWM